MPPPSLTEEHFSSNPIWSLREAADRSIWPHYGPRRWNEAKQHLAKVAKGMLEKSIAIPGGPLSDLISERLLPDDFEVPKRGPTPGVVGVVVDDSAGFVVPLSVKKSNLWSASARLPFSSDAIEIQKAMTRLVEAVPGSVNGVFPELLEFNLEGGLFLREKAEGPSMIIAGLLAVIRALANDEPEVKTLSCACSMVEPDASGQLQGVNSVPVKIEAFLREYGRGVGLLVRHPDCSESSQFVKDFKRVWEVRCFSDLAGYLEPKGLLAPLLKQVPLDRHKLAKLNETLRFLEEARHDYLQAINLAKRIDSWHIAKDVPLTEKQNHKYRIAASYRHLGRFEDAIRVAEEIEESLRKAKHCTSHDELAKAAVAVAAAHHDGHDFFSIREKLTPWREKLVADALLLTPDARIGILNTLGRAQVILGAPDWEENFRKSISLQEECDVSQVPRSRNYLIIGLLWRGDRREEARAEIALNEAVVAKEDFFSRWMLKFQTAEYHRGQGQSWDDEAIEREAERVLTPGHESSGLPGHPLAYYFQATARQDGRSDAAKRFQLASDLFHKDIHANSPDSILFFYSSVMRLAKAAVSGDTTQWRCARKQVDDYLSNPQRARIQRYYEESFSALGESPDFEAVEGLLRRLPLI